MKVYWSKKQDPDSFDTPDCHSIFLPYAEFWLSLFIKIRCRFGKHKYHWTDLGDRHHIHVCKYCKKIDGFTVIADPNWKINIDEN